MSGDPELYFAEDGTPRSARFGDIYYSPQDGLAESRAVFLQGCHLQQAWAGGGDFTILELGFGTGLNIAAAMQLWIQSGCPGHLHIFTVEAFVMARDQATKALANWPELAQFAQGLAGQWPAVRRGFHHMDFPQWKVNVTVALMEVRDALAAWEGKADAVFLDGFSPALNPDMWAEDVLQKVADHCRPGARLGTFTVAGFVRRGLQSAGFTVEKCPGFGRKRERLEGVLAGDAAAKTPRPQRLAVIGAGIAGAAVAWQAKALGLEVEVFDPAPGSGASGNDAALVTPRLDAGDNAISALFVDAFDYAKDFYSHLCPEAILGRGVLQRAMTERDEVRFGKIVGQRGFEKGDLDLDQDGLRLGSGLSLAPNSVLAALLDGLTIVPEPVTAVSMGAVTTEAGQYTGYDAIVLACGGGIFDLGSAGHLDLRAVRGQLEIVIGQVGLQTGLNEAVAWGGYAIPLPDGLLFGSTHDRDDRGSDVRPESLARNLASLAEGLPDIRAGLDEKAVTSRASIRVTTRDYLPAVGEVGPGVHVLTGLGARGFCLAPLLAKALLADIVGAGAPLPADSKRLLRPYRLAVN